MHCRKQKVEYSQPTPKKRLRGKRGSSVPMDVTNTNFFTFACVAAAIRFLVPCTTCGHSLIKICMETRNPATSYVQVEMHMHPPENRDSEAARERHTLLQMHYLGCAQA